MRGSNVDAVEDGQRIQRPAASPLSEVELRSLAPRLSGRVDCSPLHPQHQRVGTLGRCKAPPDRLFFAREQGTLAWMNKTVIEVQVRAVLPTSGGCAVFLGNNDKVFIIYVDQTVGSSITMFMRDISKERPLTHDLIAHLMTALGARVERVIINDLKNATYYARMIIRAENELQQKKIVELDGRPSDCIAMATQQKAPIYVSQEVWDEVDDMSDVLRKMEEEGLKPDPEAESAEEE